MAWDKAPLKEEHLVECAALYQAIKDWNAGKPKNERISQQKAAEMSGMSQGAFSSFLNGKLVLNKNVALVVFKAYGIPAEVYSPRLALEIKKLNVMNDGPAPIDEAASEQAPSPSHRKPPQSLIRGWEKLNTALIRLPSVSVSQMPKALEEIEAERQRLGAILQSLMYGD